MFGSLLAVTQSNTESFASARGMYDPETPSFYNSTLPLFLLTMQLSSYIMVVKRNLATLNSLLDLIASISAHLTTKMTTITRTIKRRASPRQRHPITVPIITSLLSLFDYFLIATTTINACPTWKTSHFPWHIWLSSPNICPPQVTQYTKIPKVLYSYQRDHGFVPCADTEVPTRATLLVCFRQDGCEGPMDLNSLGL
jgi:hypothetical protein